MEYDILNMRKTWILGVKAKSYRLNYDPPQNNMLNS